MNTFLLFFNLPNLCRVKHELMMKRSLSSKQQKLSGAQFRKRRKKQEEEAKKPSKVMEALAAGQLAPYTNARSGLRSSIYTTLLAVPKFSRKEYQSAADKSFFSAAPKLWNALPSSLRSSPTLPVFKKTLKTHLYPM